MHILIYTILPLALLCCAIIYVSPKYIINKIAAIYPSVIFKVSTNKIILTIDDVPYGSEGDILKILDKYNTKATLFVIGGEINDANKHVLVKAVLNGHHLANHGITNSMHLLKTNTQLITELIGCQKIIDDIYDEAKIKLPKKKYYRPGCGVFNQRMIDLVEKEGFTMVLGMVYPHDPHVFIPIINYWYTTWKINSGDVVIIHDRKWTPPMLDRLLNTTQFMFGSIDDLDT